MRKRFSTKHEHVKCLDAEVMVCQKKATPPSLSRGVAHPVMAACVRTTAELATLVRCIVNGKA